MVFTASSVMQGQTNRQVLGEYRQRALRKHATDAEHALWRRLKRRQLEGCTFRRQQGQR
jgi:very-short-patch-repair endonuclease